MTSFDPAVSIVGLYLYNNSYAFQNLALSFDADNNLKGSLSYYVTGEYSAKTEFSFSNVGTTVLEEVESIAPAINFLLSM